eukprot:CAMPEP_0114537154 /NCGR_PEP_ID=MMETSP0109-20121206/29415_1 /TAXON_ID=29199 /ORGANISM="Chlorarachnion reptans, Strain CCCM449" /LENGTH=444 /DNA_ID=CAMNT_0001721001 /DNA_START=137 /DNA_END=1471 /DNA_ORIENTATION=-
MAILLLVSLFSAASTPSPARTKLLSHLSRCQYPQTLQRCQHQPKFGPWRSPPSLTRDRAHPNRYSFDSIRSRCSPGIRCLALPPSTSSSSSPPSPAAESSSSSSSSSSPRRSPRLPAPSTSTSAMPMAPDKVDNANGRDLGSGSGVNSEEASKADRAVLMDQIDVVDDETQFLPSAAAASELWMGTAIGLLTGICVVLFSNTIHVLQNLFGISFLSEIQSSDMPDIFTPLLGDHGNEDLEFFNKMRHLMAPVIGAFLSTALIALTSSPNSIDMANNTSDSSHKRWSVKSKRNPIARILAAAINLGSGNSLGPEGPSVNIGRAWAAKLSASPMALAAGMAAGVSAGFDAPLSGVLFALERAIPLAQNQLRANGHQQSASNASWSATTEDTKQEDLLAGVVVAAVAAAVASRIGLGEAPALFAIPRYQLGSYFELLGLELSVALLH